MVKGKSVPEVIHFSLMGEFLLDRMVLEGCVSGEPGRDQLFIGKPWPSVTKDLVQKR